MLNLDNTLKTTEMQRKRERQRNYFVYEESERWNLLLKFAKCLFPISVNVGDRFLDIICRFKEQFSG